MDFIFSVDKLKTLCEFFFVQLKTNLRTKSFSIHELATFLRNSFWIKVKKLCLKDVRMYELTPHYGAKIFFGFVFEFS